MISMRKESGEITSDREEIINIYAAFYSAHTRKYNDIKSRQEKFSSLHHSEALTEIIEKSNEYNLPLWIGFIDYEKACDTVEQICHL